VESGTSLNDHSIAIGRRFHAPHRTQIDDEADVASTVSSDMVPSAADCYRQGGAGKTSQRMADIVTVSAAKDRCWIAIVVHRVPYFS